MNINKAGGEKLVKRNATKASGGTDTLYATNLVKSQTSIINSNDKDLKTAPSSEQTIKQVQSNKRKGRRRRKKIKSGPTNQSEHGNVQDLGPTY